jgi:hypothetical protein
MKIRQGFVSNSSSSSFVIAWSKKPETVEEMSNFLFGENKEYPNPYPFEDTPDCFSVSLVSERLMNSLDWDENEVRNTLVEDLGSHISYLLREVSEKHTNCYTFEDGGLISCLSLARKEVHEITALLKKRYPKVNWVARIKAVVDHRNKWHKIEESVQKEVYKIQDKLRKEHDCQQLPWQNASTMTEEQKVAYKKACDENYKKYKTLVLEDPRYKAVEKKRRDIYHKGKDTKKINETLSLIANRLADIFYTDNKGSQFSVVEIGDDSSLGSAMEHGELFSRLPHKTFSHH